MAKKQTTRKTKTTKEQKVIKCVAYCRKSTKEDGYETSMKDQKARIKRLRPVDSESTYEIVRWYEKDFGIPGWKRGSKRPDWFLLVQELKETGAKAILVDDMDRFSRADKWEVVSDVQELRKLGIRFIHACNQGCQDLLQGESAFWSIAAAAMSSHDFSKRLSRRISETRLKYAKDGLRSGGRAPYGMQRAFEDGSPVPDGWVYEKGKPVPRFVIPGDPTEVKVVRWVFDMFTKFKKSMNWIASQLNKQGVPTSRNGEKGSDKYSGKWYVQTIKNMLQRKAYAGVFSYNEDCNGQFYQVDEDLNVVPVSPYDEERVTPGLLTKIIDTSKHKPIIPPKQFAEAQKRLEDFTLKGSREPRADGYALSNVLFCSHCGKPLYGCKPSKRKTGKVYRCPSNAKSGSGTCGYYQVSEEMVLPGILEMLAQELENLDQDFLTVKTPDTTLRNIAKEQARNDARKAELQRKIDTMTEGLFDIADKRTRQQVDKRITEMRDELDTLNRQDRESVDSEQDREALLQWWKEFRERALEIPLGKESGNKTRKASWELSKADIRMRLLSTDKDGNRYFKIDPRQVNEALHSLGCRVDLQWEVDETKSRGKYSLLPGRFRLGQRTGTLVIQSKGQTADSDVTCQPIPLNILSRVDRIFQVSELVA